MCFSPIKICSIGYFIISAPPEELVIPSVS
jgi:hypothetical protein